MEHDPEAMVKTVEDLLRGEKLEEAVEAVASIHPADQADLFWHLQPELRESFLALLSAEGLARLLEYLDPDERSEVVDNMPRASLARVLDRMSNDVAADVLYELAPAERVRVLSTMSTAPEVTPLLDHAVESAGGIMTRGFVALHGDMSAQDAINYLRLRKPDVEEAYYLYVLDAQNRVQGVVSLRELVVASSDTPLREVMSGDVISVGPEADQEEAARLIQHYRLRALPVLDEERHLLGIATMDDAMAVASEEATESCARGPATEGSESLDALVAGMAKRIAQRIPPQEPWMITVTVEGADEDTATHENTLTNVLVHHLQSLSGEDKCFLLTTDRIRDKVLEEQRESLADPFDPSTGEEVGRLVRANAKLWVPFRRLHNRLVLTPQLISLRTGMALFSISINSQYSYCYNKKYSIHLCKENPFRLN